MPPDDAMKPTGRLVLALFSKSGYRPPMPDDDKLTPADPRDVEIALSLALTSGRSLERAQAAEVTAKVVAERLVAKLEQSGFVIMRKPIDTATPRRPEGWLHTPTR